MTEERNAAHETEDDATRVRPRAADPEATVVRPQRVDPEATVVVPQRADPEETVVVPRRIDPEATIVVPVGERKGDDSDEHTRVAPRRRKNAEPEQRDQTNAPAGPVADPVADPEPHSEAPLSSASLARVYGPRSEDQASLPAGPDLVLQQIGPAPVAQELTPPAPREQLPSLVRRFRRERIVTLGAYAAAIVISVLGLWVIACVAF